MDGFLPVGLYLAPVSFYEKQSLLTSYLEFPRKPSSLVTDRIWNFVMTS